MPTDSTRLEAVPSLKGLGVWAIFVPGTAVPGFHMPRLRGWTSENPKSHRSVEL